MRVILNRRVFGNTTFTRCFSTGVKDPQEEKNCQKIHKFHPPTLEEVRQSPLSIHRSSNEAIINLAFSGVSEARAELLKRHIMDIDSVDYSEALKIFEKIHKANTKAHWHALPNKCGVVFSSVAAFISFPMVFDYKTVLSFNKNFVTADIPEPKDLETWLEVGSWSWNWMEPVLGHLSFFLLCLAFARAQFKTLGIKPYSKAILESRAETLAKEFPKYDPDIIKLYSMSQPFEWSFVNIARKVQGL